MKERLQHIKKFSRLYIQGSELCSPPLIEERYDVNSISTDIKEVQYLLDFSDYYLPELLN